MNIDSLSPSGVALPIPGEGVPANQVSEREINASFRRLREVLAGCDPKASRHDHADFLIYVCIEEGLDTGKRIVGALHKLGFDKQHVGIRLTKGTGNDPVAHRWRLNADGTYSNHD